MSGDGLARISLALGAGKKPGKPLATNGVKRSHAALREEDDEEHVETTPQNVSHFDKETGSAISENSKPKKEPLVIQARANRNWKDASKRRKQAHERPWESQGNGMSEQGVVVQEEVRPTPGLHVQKRSVSEDVTLTNGHLAQAEVGQQQAHEPDAEAPAKAKTDDELAMDALLGRTKKSDLTIPAITEEEAFEQDYHEAPDMATLEEYDRVPVEQFGAAMLRGMGWKDGEGLGSERGKKTVKTKLPERRPALLGIGAKEEAAVAQELGTWGKAAKDRKGPQQIYNPVLLRDKQTGEMFTEEELERKKQREEQKKLDFEFEQKEREREHRRRRDEDSDFDRRDKDRRRGRDRDRDRRDERERDRRKRDDSEEEYFRRKREKERRRREREREDSDYDRERSRRHEKDVDRHRERRGDRDRRR